MRARLGRWEHPHRWTVALVRGRRSWLISAHCTVCGEPITIPVPTNILAPCAGAQPTQGVIMSTTDLPVTRDENGDPTPAPSPKVVAAGTGAVVGGAISTLGIYAFESISGIDLPQLVEGSVLTLVVAAVAFLAGYIKRPAG